MPLQMTNILSYKTKTSLNTKAMKEIGKTRKTRAKNRQNKLAFPRTMAYCPFGGPRAHACARNENFARTVKLAFFHGKTVLKIKKSFSRSCARHRTAGIETENFPETQRASEREENRFRPVFCARRTMGAGPPKRMKRLGER